MVKIAIGQTKQADFVQEGCFEPVGPPGLEEEMQTVHWVISGNTGASNSITLDDGSPGAGYSGEPGWTATPEGVIKVAPGASPGIYSLIYTDGPCPFAGEDGGYKTKTYEYEFEVVCLKVTLRSYTRSLP